jgi:mannose-1-phosphate guanylyltransferase
MVLTAGLGTRLSPLSGIRAKPALPVAGESLIRRILRWLRESGLTSVVLNLHHRPETIAREVGDGGDLGLAVRYSWEHPLLGSAGGPRKALPLLDAARFLLVNGDTITNVNLSALRAEHERSQALVTMALIPNPAPEKYGGVKVGDEGWIEGFAAPGASGAPYHFIGAQMVEARVFADLESGIPANSVGGLYSQLLARDRRTLRAFVSNATFQDIGTPADYLATSLAIAALEQRGGTIPPGPGSIVDPTARLIRSIVWNDAVIGPGSELTECIVADGVRVPPRSRLERMVLTPAGRDLSPGERLAGDAIATPLDRSAT